VLAGFHIDGARLYAALDALGDIGAYDDPGSGRRGVDRLALTARDGAGRRHVVGRMAALGLQVTVDRIGNVYARRPGVEDHLPPVMIGSHIDSVPTAGRFDGCLGVLGGLEVVETLNDLGRATRRPLVVAFFTDEEGCRFGTDMLGSGVATGRLDLDFAYGLRDRDGRVLRDELAAIGFLGDAPARVEPPHAFLECHIEQGPLLAAAGVQLGVVTGVQGISWQELQIEGRSAHAGTTPMHLRRDAGIAAARINLAMRAMCRSGDYGALRATMGGIAPVPGLVNIVPGRVACTVDLRNPDEPLLRRAEADLQEAIAAIAAEEGVRVTARQTARTPPVAFDPGIQDRIAAEIDALGLSRQHLISGAGHDAQEFARVCPTGMIFVPGEDEGISHNPREHSTPEQCARGVEVLYRVALALLDAPG
jgi:beta-ureidopropionase / N-carbamoyl-L-amino-acid hydrolase